MKRLITELAPRQYNVLTLLCRGKSNKQIAFNFAFSEHTVKRHVRGVLQALNTENKMPTVIMVKSLFSQRDNAQ